MPGMPIARFHVFGQRCSGTNALIRLVEHNFPALRFCEAAGFKHWFVPGDRRIAADAAVIVIARDVSEWLRSLHARPWHAHPDLKALSFAAFIRAEWHSVWDGDFWGVDEGDPRFGTPIREELCPATGRPFANAVAKRAAKLRNWIALGERAPAALFVDHARLVASPREIVAEIAQATGCAPVSDFVPVASYKGQGERPFVPRSYPPLSREDAGFVGLHLDAASESRFGLALPG